MDAALREQIDRFYGRLVEIRHELHAHPELSYQEHETSGRLAGWLGEIDGLSVRTGLGGGTGLLATLETGRPGPNVALRADIDALPILEQNEFDWASKNQGKMHACGHDGHTTCLVGAAMVLASLRDKLSGTVRFIFQPAEENGAGALAMIKDGVLDTDGGGQVDAIFGLHASNAHDVGTMKTRPGPINASAFSFDVSISGKGCHGAAPHLGHDPVVAAGQVLVALQTLVSRNVDPLDSAVVTIGRIDGGTARNIIPDACRLEGTLRTLNDATNKLMQRRIEEVVGRVSGAMGCTGRVEWGGAGYPSNVNDADLVAWAGETATRLLGEGNVDLARRVGMGGEDFSFYGQRVPSTFCYIGVRPAGQSAYPPLHTPTFDFTDEAIRTGVALHAGWTLRASAEGLPPRKESK